MRRTTVIIFILLYLLGPSTPAWAHGGGGTDATNFLSDITGIASAATSDGGPTVGLPSLKWRVIAGDALLEVTNEGSEVLEVPGYAGEPYLRIGPSGVMRNENSPATYLNEERYGTAVPPDVTEDADPRWAKVSDEPSYAWHDHRIHWMSLSLPPAVAANQDDETVVFDWTVPFSLDEQSYALNGRLLWIPPLEIWPWLVGSIAVMTLPFLGGFMLSGSSRRRYLLRTGSFLVLIASFLSTVHTVDDLVAVPATAIENLFAGMKALPFIAGGFVGGVWGWRGTKRPELGLAIGAGSVSLGIGIAHVFALSNSQIATTLPEMFSRLTFAGTMTLVVPVGVAAWLAWKQAGGGRQHVVSPSTG